MAAIEPLLIAEIRSYRRSWRVGALTLAGTLWLIVGVGALLLSRKDALQAAILAAVLGVPAVLLLLFASSGNPARDKALVAIRARSHSLVWIYTRLFHGSLRVDQLVFNFEDGSSHAIHVDPARSEDLLSRAAALFPRASVGFSPEAARIFARAPHELYRHEPRAIAAPPDALDTAWLLPFAIATHATRRWVAGLGLLLILLGGLGIFIVAAAASARDQPAFIITMLTFVAVLPGLLVARWGFAPFEKTDLAVALRSPADRVRRVEITHQTNVEGDYVDVAVVTLTTGRTFVFWVDPKAKGIPS